jgi:hypothetical protein
MLNGNMDVARGQFKTMGYFLNTEPVISGARIDSARHAVDRVIAGDYETGIAPVQRNWLPGDDPGKLRKIDQAHFSDRTLWNTVTDTRLGERIGRLMDAQFVQLWAAQLLLKPPGPSDLGSIGWHQDIAYWKDAWEGEVFTAWLALSDVTLDSGPMIFVPHSHRWGELSNLDFWDTNREAQRERIGIPAGESWSEVPAVLRPGAFSLHSPYLVHGSGSNTSQSSRVSLALHLRTERSKPNLGATLYPKYTASYMPYLDRPDICPIIWKRS